MPAFTFEKISPARRSSAAPAADKKQRGLLVQILDRFAGRRTRRSSENKRSPEKMGGPVTRQRAKVGKD